MNTSKFHVVPGIVRSSLVGTVGHACELGQTVICSYPRHYRLVTGRSNNDVTIGPRIAITRLGN